MFVCLSVCRYVCISVSLRMCHEEHVQISPNFAVRITYVHSSVFGLVVLQYVMYFLFCG